MPYESKPQFPAVERANAGEIVTLEGVKIAFVFDLAQGDGWTRQDFKFMSADGLHECKGKYWRPEKVLNTGQIVTVVGGVEEYQGKKSVSIDAKKGGGIASEGEPLATVAPTAPTAPPQEAAAPFNPDKMHVDEYRSFLLRQTKKVLASDTVTGWLEDGKITFAQAIDYARALASGIGIARLRNDIDEELPF